MLLDSRSLKKDKSVIPGVKVNATNPPSVKQMYSQKPTRLAHISCLEKTACLLGYHRYVNICLYIHIIIYLYIHRISSKHPTIDLHNLCDFPSEWLHYLALPVNNSAILLTLGCKSVGPHRCSWESKGVIPCTPPKTNSEFTRKAMTVFVDDPVSFLISVTNFNRASKISGEYVLKPPSTFWRSYMQKETFKTHPTWGVKRCKAISLILRACFTDNTSYPRNLRFDDGPILP